MTAPYRKKLIEVALPLKAINEASAREKSIRHGHPSTLHLWWARRPLAACRAVLFASLVDDPDSDPAYRKADGTVDEDLAGVKRAELFNLIEELVRWENSNNPRVINAARAEIARCVASRKIELGELANDEIIFGEKKGQKHPKGPVSGEGITAWEVLLLKARPEVVNAFLAEHAPPVLDPFCGGGSIPLEAQRLGLRAYASDLNPVPVLITKALIEIPPMFAGRPPVNPDWQKKSKEQKATTVWQGAQGLAEDVRYYGKWMRDEAERRIGHFYPKVKITEELAKGRPDLQSYVGQNLTAIAWIWARTIKSPDPVFQNARVPLVKSFWLSKKKGKKAWVDVSVDKSSGNYQFHVKTGEGSSDRSDLTGTVDRKGGRCILSGSAIPFESIRAAGKAGQLGCRLLAIVAEGNRGRVYLPPIPSHEKAAEAIPTAQDVPETPMAHNPFSLRPPLYGLDRFCDIFSRRQLAALTTFSDLIGVLNRKIAVDAIKAGLSNDSRPIGDSGGGAEAYANAVSTYLAFATDKGANYWSAMCAWSTTTEKMVSTFGRQAIPMIWDYAEANPFSDSTGNFSLGVEQAVKMLIECLSDRSGVVHQHDAARPYTNVSQSVISTDPPYYNNIDYADLSDFFYSWLRRSLKPYYPSLFTTVVVPKDTEIVASPYRFDGSKEQANSFFEKTLRQAFTQMKSAQQPEYPLSVYYAFKQAESNERDEDDETPAQTVASTGWETMLEGLISSGFSLCGTWPMRTELTGNLKGHMNVLASSVVLVARPQPGNQRIATRKEFMTALRSELPSALRTLQHGNIAPVDLAQSAIGPGMAILTRYAKVIESDGRQMTVRTALGIINQVLDEVLAEQEGDFDADTRWALAWFDQFGMAEGPFGVAETLSKAKNTAVNGLVEAGVVKARAGKVQLVGRNDLTDGWDPTTDKRLTVWETTQHLIRRLETKGESEAAALMNKLGGVAETARELAYRLYSICERKKWADEALAYNGLVIVWPELTKLARSAAMRQETVQQDLF
jgi:putative DNA methylase